MKLITAIALFAGLVLTSAMPAAAANIQVSGEQTVVDPALGISEMSGSLVGTWYTTTFQCNTTPAGDRWPCTGTELFVGCLDASGDGTCGQEQVGTLEFEFNFTGTPVGNGRCQHVITSGIGAFMGASGVITMKDRPTAGGIVTSYLGHIEL